MSRSRKNREDLGKFWISGSRASGGGGISIANFTKRIARKLRKIILPHLGLITFGINFGKTQQPIIFMVSGRGGRDHESPNQYDLPLETPGYL